MLRDEEWSSFYAFRVCFLFDFLIIVLDLSWLSFWQAFEIEKLRYQRRGNFVLTRSRAWPCSVHVKLRASTSTHGSTKIFGTNRLAYPIPLYLQIRWMHFSRLNSTCPYSNTFSLSREGDREEWNWPRRRCSSSTTTRGVVPSTQPSRKILFWRTVRTEHKYAHSIEHWELLSQWTLFVPASLKDPDDFSVGQARPSMHGNW